MANSLLVKLGFDFDKKSISESVTGIDRVTNSLKNLRRSVGLITAGLGLKNLATGFKDIFSHVKGSIQKSYDLAEGYAAAGDKIAKTSRLIGFSVKDYQALSSAAQHAGMSVDEMDSSLKRFSIELGKAHNGDKSSLKMFDAILGGKSLSNYKDSASLLKEIANGYSKLASAEQKAFVSQSLFGKSGLKMSELLSGGGEGIDKLIADFESVGGGFSDKGAKDAEEFNDELQKMRETIDSLKIAVAQELFPTFIDLFKSVRAFVKENKKEIIPIVREIFACSAEIVKSILPKIPVILDVVLSVVKNISPHLMTIGLCLISMGPAVMNIVIGFLSVLPIVTKIFGLISGPVLGSIILVVGAVVSWGIAIKSVVKNINLIPDAIDWVFATIKESIEWWWNLAKGFHSWFVGSLNDIGYSIADTIREKVMNVLDIIYGAMQKLRGFISGIFGGLPDRLQNFFGIGKAIESANGPGAVQTLGASAAQAVSESRTTVTNRFAVDFKNMPRGVQVTPPEQGDFDWSRGYVLGGA